MRDDLRGRRPLLVLFCVGVSVLMIAPTMVVIPLSFSADQSYTFPPSGYSTRWYENFFSDPGWYNAAMLSLRVAGTVAALATVLGTLAALGLVRGAGRWRGVAQALLMAPMIIPGVIVAIGIYYVFLKWHLSETFLGFVAAHTIMAVPFVIVTVSASLASVDRQLEQAAASLGATPFRTFRHITLPLIAPGMIVGALFAFLTSFDESIVSLFLSGPFKRTLPVQLYQSVTAEIDPTGAAAASMFIAITTTLLAVIGVLAARRSTAS